MILWNERRERLMRGKRVVRRFGRIQVVLEVNEREGK